MIAQTESGAHVLSEREEIRFILRMGDLHEIASPGFRRRVKLAREQGLLDAVLADDQEAVMERTSQLLSELAAQMCRVAPEAQSCVNRRRETPVQPQMGISPS